MVEQHIPLNPALCSCVEVADDVNGVLLGLLPGRSSNVLSCRVFERRLSCEKIESGIGSMEFFKELVVLEIVAVCREKRGDSTASVW